MTSVGTPLCLATRSTTTADVLVASVPLYGGGPVQPGEVSVPLTVPAEAPGTAVKSIEWLVRAVVDRRMGSDDKQATPLVVRQRAGHWHMFGLVLLGDLVTLYVAVLRGVDPTPVAVIDQLKERLAGLG